MFALYLDIQKSLDLETLSDTEARGRWKSFVGKWYGLQGQFGSGVSCASSYGLLRVKGFPLTLLRNRGELAEGWYDPATLQKAIEPSAKSSTPDGAASRRRASPDYGSSVKAITGNAESSDEDDIGPALPSHLEKHVKQSHRSGPSIPTMQDLELQRGTSSSSWCEDHSLRQISVSKLLVN